MLKKLFPYFLVVALVFASIWTAPAVAATASRFVTLVNTAGVTIGSAASSYLSVRLTDGTSFLTAATDQTEDVAESGADRGPVVFGVRRDAAASSSGTTSDFSTFNFDILGQLWTRQLDPCTGVARTTVPISVATDTAVITASASNRNYICGGFLFANAAEVVGIWEGTGTACGTSSAALIGSTTEANSLNLAAQQGFIIPQSMRGLSTNVDTCIRVVGTSRITGYLEIVQAP